MGIRQEVGAALARVCDRDGDDPQLLPVQLTRVAAAAAGVDGVGLGVQDTAGHSAPLRTGDEAATTAERPRFTAGPGPCTSAAHSGWPVFAAEDRLRTRRPAFHDLLVAHTAFRSVVALPLPGDLRGSGGMDRYLTRPAGPETFDAVAAVCVAELLAAGRGRAEGRRTAGPPDRRMTGCARW